MVEVATTASTSPPEWQKQFWNTLQQRGQEQDLCLQRMGEGHGEAEVLWSGQRAASGGQAVTFWEWLPTRDAGLLGGHGGWAQLATACSPGLHGQDSAGEALFRCRGSTVTQEGSCRETHWPYSEGGPHRSCHGSSKTCDLGPGDLG